MYLHDYLDVYFSSCGTVVGCGVLGRLRFSQQVEAGFPWAEQEGLCQDLIMEVLLSNPETPISLS